jgi:hypothetical protein
VRSWPASCLAYTAHPLLARCHAGPLLLPRCHAASFAPAPPARAAPAALAPSTPRPHMPAPRARYLPPVLRRSRAAPAPYVRAHRLSSRRSLGPLLLCRAAARALAPAPLESPEPLLLACLSQRAPAACTPLLGSPAPRRSRACALAPASARARAATGLSRPPPLAQLSAAPREPALPQRHVDPGRAERPPLRLPRWRRPASGSPAPEPALAEPAPRTALRQSHPICTAWRRREREKTVGIRMEPGRVCCRWGKG